MMTKFNEGKQGKDTQLIDITFEAIINETPKAWLLIFPNKPDEIWFPKSECEVYEQNYVVTMPAWLAREKDLI